MSVTAARSASDSVTSAAPAGTSRPSGRSNVPGTYSWRVLGVSDARADVMGLSDYVYQRTRSRVAGLTDDEYFWEPVSGCWTIRRTDSGAYRADSADWPVAVLRPATGAGDPPFTTIA